MVLIYFFFFASHCYLSILSGLIFRKSQLHMTVSNLCVTKVQLVFVWLTHLCDPPQFAYCHRHNLLLSTCFNRVSLSDQSRHPFEDLTL